MAKAEGPLAVRIVQAPFDGLGVAPPCAADRVLPGQRGTWPAVAVGPVTPGADADQHAATHAEEQAKGAGGKSPGTAGDWRRGGERVMMAWGFRQPAFLHFQGLGTGIPRPYLRLGTLHRRPAPGLRGRRATPTAPYGPAPVGGADGAQRGTVIGVGGGQVRDSPE